MGVCWRCEAAITDQALLNHVRLLHPDVEIERAEVECWPDGCPVVVYEDPEPWNVTGDAA